MGHPVLGWRRLTAVCSVIFRTTRNLSLFFFSLSNYCISRDAQRFGFRLVLRTMFVALFVFAWSVFAFVRSSEFSQRQMRCSDVVVPRNKATPPCWRYAQCEAVASQQCGQKKSGKFSCQRDSRTVNSIAAAVVV